MKCKKCGKEIISKAKFCKYCGVLTGQGVLKNVKSIEVAAASPVKSTMRPSGIVIAVVFIVALVFVIFFTGKGQTKLQFSVPSLPEVGGCGTTPNDTGKVAGADVRELEINAPFEEPFDIAVTGDGSELFVADDGKGAVFMFARTGEGVYKLRNTIVLAGRDSEKLKGQPCYVTIDEKGKKIFVVDCGNGTLSEYNWNGAFKKRLAKSDYLSGTRSIRYQAYRGGTLVTSVPPYNDAVLYNTNGTINKEFVLPSGTQCNNFRQPCYAVIDSSGRLFVEDAENKATKIFKLPEMKFERAIRNEGCSTIKGPQIVLFDDAKIPFFARTSQHTNAIVFSLKDGSKSAAVSLTTDRAIGFDSPTAMAADASGNIYVISPDSKKVVMVKLSGSVFK